MHHDPARSIAPYHVRVLGVDEDARVKVDSVAVEAPLELRINGRSITILMRTPGSDEELAIGFLHGEGIITGPEEILAIREPLALEEDRQGNVLDVRLATPSLSRVMERFFASSSSCGVCGKQSIDALLEPKASVKSDVVISCRVLSQLPESLRAAQGDFSRTGGVHASGLFTTAGELLGLREDAGRHNALDKLIGWTVRNQRLPLKDNVLLVSGRVSYELVQKGIMAGLPIMAAIGAPSSLAIDLAERFNVTLIGFLRGTSMNVYAHAHRITGG